MSHIIKEIPQSFEQTLGHQRQQWVLENWYMTLAIGVAYLGIVFVCRTVMRDRQAFNLRPLLITWNLGLTIFSVLGVRYMLPELIHILRLGGFKMSICDNGYIYYSSTSSWWAWLFVASKVVELGDTIFIVLRKQPLMFLHWFHHTFTMIGVSYSYATGHAVGRWVACMNYAIHSFMYGYYLLRSLKVPVPKFIAVIITTMQIVQMFLGFSLSFWAMVIYLNGEPCQVTLNNSMFTITMYIIYFYLFIQFFRSAYVTKSRSAKISKQN